MPEFDVQIELSLDLGYYHGRPQGMHWPKSEEELIDKINRLGILWERGASLSPESRQYAARLFRLICMSVSLLKRSFEGDRWWALWIPPDPNNPFRPTVIFEEIP